MNSNLKENSFHARENLNFVHKLGLGTAQFGLPYGANLAEQMSFEEALAVIQFAQISGVELLDTARAYGNSESILGRIGVDEFKIVTKVPSLEKENDPVSALLNHVKTSLSELNFKNVHAVLFHRPLELLSHRGTSIMKCMENLKSEGVIDKIGISIYSPVELDQLSKYFNFDLVQAPLNLLDQSLITSGWLARLVDANVEVHIRSIFLQGALLLPMNRLPTYFSRWHSHFKAYQDWAIELNISLLQACLSFAFSQPGISKVILGVNHLAHLNEIVGELKSLPSVQFPAELVSNDIELINPSYWRVEA